MASLSSRIQSKPIGRLVGLGLYRPSVVWALLKLRKSTNRCVELLHKDDGLQSVAVEQIQIIDTIMWTSL